MITKVSIRDFQSLGKVDLDLAPFTVIIGESDIGKSAVVRAIKALVVNRSGQDFIRMGAKKAAVALTLSDGTVVAWVKDESATYRLRQGTETKEYAKTGRTVPAEVQQVLKMGEIAISDERLLPNFSEQFDQPFLVTASSITRAKILGELSGMNILYLSLAEVRRREAAARRTQTIRQGDLEGVQAQLRGFQYLTLAKERLETVAGLLAEVETASDEYAGLHQAVVLLETSKLKAAKLDREAATIARARDRWEAIARLADQVLEMSRDGNRLLDASHMLTARTQAVEALEKELAQFTVELGKIKMCPTCGKPLKAGELLAHYG